MQIEGLTLEPIPEDELNAPWGWYCQVEKQIVQMGTFADTVNVHTPLPDQCTGSNRPNHLECGWVEEVSGPAESG